MCQTQKRSVYIDLLLLLLMAQWHKALTTHKLFILKCSATALWLNDMLPVAVCDAIVTSKQALYNCQKTSWLWKQSLWKLTGSSVSVYCYWWYSRVFCLWSKCGCDEGIEWNTSPGDQTLGQAEKHCTNQNELAAKERCQAFSSDRTAQEERKCFFDHAHILNEFDFWQGHLRGRQKSLKILKVQVCLLWSNIPVCFYSYWCSKNTSF